MTHENKKAIHEVDAAYIAGLFDGEGTVTYKKYREKKKDRQGNTRYANAWRISMEIAMTDQSVLIWLHQVLGTGTLNKKPRDKTGHKMQYRWRCTFRDAYYVCLLIWPFAHVKLDKITQIIDHYSGQDWVLQHENVISLEQYKQWKQTNAR